jgi:hypothetical protein
MLCESKHDLFLISDEVSAPSMLPGYRSSGICAGLDTLIMFTSCFHLVLFRYEICRLTSIQRSSATQVV